LMKATTMMKEDRGAELDRKREMLKRANKAVTALAEEYSKAKANDRRTNRRSRVSRTEHSRAAAKSS